MTSPTQLTKKHCAKLDWVVTVAEYWNSFARIRQDLFGFIDLVALTGESIIGIQATTRGNVASRKAKIDALEAAVEWQKSGGIIEVWGWGKLCARNSDGKRLKQKTWQLVRWRRRKDGGWIEEN